MMQSRKAIVSIRRVYTLIAISVFLTQDDEQERIFQRERQEIEMIKEVGMPPRRHNQGMLAGLTDPKHSQDRALSQLLPSTTLSLLWTHIMYY